MSIFDKIYFVIFLNLISVTYTSQIVIRSLCIIIEKSSPTILLQILKYFEFFIENKNNKNNNRNAKGNLNLYK